MQTAEPSYKQPGFYPAYRPTRADKSVYYMTQCTPTGKERRFNLIISDGVCRTMVTHTERDSALYTIALDMPKGVTLIDAEHDKFRQVVKIRVAVVGAGTLIDLEDDALGFPSERLLTKLRLLKP